MSNILRYQKSHEDELLALLKKEPDWRSFTRDEAIARFRQSLLESESYICVSDGFICGYIRALVDGFGIYVSELYVAPPYRNKGYGKALLATIKQAHLAQDLYVFSDEDQFYEKLGSKRVGSIFHL